MLTPAFELGQEADFLLLTIRVPYTRTSEFDIYIDGEDFKFYAKPYFLRLTLPGRIVEDGREEASFDIDKGLFTLRVPKESPGEHFEGLQMLTSLLAPKGSRTARPLVEDIEACGGNAAEDEEDEDEEFDWQVDQQVYEENTEDEMSSLQKYGFGNLRSGVFARLQDELGEIVDVKTPDKATASDRRRGRLAAENAKFDPDHYLADLFEDDAVQSLLKFCPWWRESSQIAGLTFTDEEKDQLRKFTNRSYLLDKKSSLLNWLGLLDIVLSYAYDVRSTEGEHSVESSWNIRKLSATLSWLETYGSVREVLVSFGRRVLCYPLHRHFALVTAAVKDAALIFRAGKACVLKCLLDIHRIFRESDPAYILNDLYITDYCVWIQRVKSEKVRSLAEPLLKTSLQKADLGLQLQELEMAAALVAEEGGEGQGGGRARARGETRERGAPTAQRNHPLPPPPAAVAAAIPRRARTLRQWSSEGERSLPPELGERVEAELRISEAPEGSHSCSGGGERQSTAARPDERTTPSRAFLEVCPRKNPLLLVPTLEERRGEEEDDDDK
ncbi:hypothetical protein GJAV_G00172970 [Gymnothorax javanicus]|nr:hypothetical protein GJAV_G00172970 [Gymnothorax javanicus]